MRYKPGVVFTDGYQRLLVQGSEEATIQKVEMLGLDPGLELLGILNAGHERKYSAIQVTKQFPPTNRAFGPLAEVQGAVVPPGKLGLELVVGLRVDSDAYVAREGVRIHYRAGSRDYVVDFPAGVVVCPQSMEMAQCKERFAAASSG